MPAPWLGKPSHPSWGLSPSREARDGLSSPLCPPQEAVSERKAAAKQRAALQQQKGKLSDLEEEAKERAQYLLQRANRMRMEQEDEIKEFSEVRPRAARPPPAPHAPNVERRRGCPQTPSNHPTARPGRALRPAPRGAARGRPLLPSSTSAAARLSVPLSLRPSVPRRAVVPRS